MLYISEIFNEFEEAKTKKEKQDILIKYSGDKTFLTIMSGVFDPRIEFIKVPKKLQYKESDSPYGFAYTTLAYEHRRLAWLLESSTMEPENKLSLLLDLLENLHAEESKILLGMVKKKLKVSGLTPKLVKEVFPQLFPKVEK